MNAFLAGQAVTVKVNAADDFGTPFAASSASYRVIDQDGNVLVDYTPIEGWTDQDVAASLTIPADMNALTAGVVRALRTVEVSFEITGDQAGMIVRSESYVIEQTETLTVPSTSFQTYQQAVLAGFNIVGITRWNTAVKSDRVAALTQAHAHLCQTHYRYERDGQDYLSEVDLPFAVGHLDLYTPAEFAGLPADFKAALCRAQVIQADHLLRPDTDPIKMRDQGIIQHKVGESESTFRQGAAPTRPMCPAAYRELAKYIASNTLRIGRS